MIILPRSVGVAASSLRRDLTWILKPFIWRKSVICRLVTAFSCMLTMLLMYCHYGIGFCYVYIHTHTYIHTYIYIYISIFRFNIMLLRVSLQVVVSIQQCCLRGCGPSECPIGRPAQLQDVAISWPCFVHAVSNKGLVWRSRLVQDGQRRVNYYIKHLGTKGRFGCGVVIVWWWWRQV